MGKFAVGDRVRVITKRFGKEQFGDCGEIYKVDDTRSGLLSIGVNFYEGCHAEKNAYEEEDLEHIAFGLLTPEFDLDEIHLGEELVNQRD